MSPAGAWPNLSPSDTRYAEALRARGVEVEAVAWNGDNEGELASFDAAVLRSNWDYHDDITGFTAWLERVERSGTRLFNPRALVLAYLDKRALKHLAATGIPMPVSHEVEADEGAIADVMRQEFWQRAVLKPVYGASGRGVQMVHAGRIGEALALIHEDVKNLLEQSPCN